MPLGLGIVEVLRAIPPRIEVTGHGPTVRITAGSFDAALDYARECYDAPAVLDCELRYRFWPRVTLTVALDPELARSAPPLEELRRRAEEREAALRAARGPAHRADPGSLRPDPGVAVEGEPEMAVEDETGLSTLEEIFAHQELRRQERYRIPVQRHGADA